MKLIMEEWRRFEEREALLANESYVRNVLGIEIPLNESYPYSPQLQEQILQEALLFQQFFDDVRELPGQAKEVFVAFKQVWSDPKQVGRYYKEVDEEADADMKPVLEFFVSIRDKFTEWLELVSDKTRGVLEYIIKMCNKVLELFEKAKKHVLSMSGLEKVLAITTLALAFQWIWDQVGESIKAGSGKLNKLISVAGGAAKGLKKRLIREEEAGQFEEMIQGFAEWFKEVVEEKIIGFIGNKIKAIMTTAFGSAISGGVTQVWGMLTKLYGGAQFVLGALMPAIKDFNVGATQSPEEAPSPAAAG